MTTDLFQTELFAPLEVGPDGIILRPGRGWPAIFNWPQGELVGRPVWNIVVEDQHEAFKNAMHSIATGAPSAIVRARASREDMTLRLMCRMEPGEAGVLWMVVEDITERNAVVPRGSTYKSLVDYAHDSWFVHDLEGRIRDANPGPSCRLCGISNAERCLGVDRYLTKPADAEALLNAVQELLWGVRIPRRILVVDEPSATASDMVRLLETKGYQVVSVCTGDQVLDKARRTHPDMILLESLGEQVGLQRSIRLERGLENECVVQLIEEQGVS